MFRPYRSPADMADTADTDRVGPIWAASAPILAASARVGIRHVARRGTTRDGRAVCGVPPASPRPATWQLRIGPMRLKSTPMRPKSGRLGPYRPYRSISAGDRYGRNRPKSAETCRNRPKQAEIGRENRRRGRNSDLRCVSCLILSLFCESSILMCFLRIF